jgi:hypothetical protein
MEQRKTNPRGATPDQRLSWSEGLEAKEIFLASGRGRTISLDIPLYRPGDSVHRGILSVMKQSLSGVLDHLKS